MPAGDDRTAARWSSRGSVYAVSPEHVAGPSLPRVMALARPGPGDRCLDLGTGAGHTAARLAEAGADVIGLDPARGMLDAARSRYGALPNLRFVEAPGDATGLPSGTFDIVTARHTLHHHADPVATLREVARLLKPGGRFVLVDEATPDPRVDAWLDAIERARDSTHVRAYALDEWQAMLRAAGLRWIVGDIETRYRMEVDAWVGRMALNEAGQAEVRRLFRQAGPLERRLFTIEYESGEAVRFEFPMALILATLPEEGRRA
jgi:SAM-dependent methyltransferase